MDRTYRFVPETGSTNDDLKEKLYQSDAPLYQVLAAGRQTGGRGRQGRAFYSPEGGVYFSVSFPLPRNCPHPAFLTLLSGLAVQKTLQKRAKTPILIKWPNDIVTGGKKLCGVLTELITAPFGPVAVVGVGLNVRFDEKDLPEDLRKTAADLFSLGIGNIDREALIREIVDSLDTFVYRERALEQPAFPYRAEYEKALSLTGRTVTRTLGEKSVTGTVKGIDDLGRLVLLTPGGTVKIDSGIVEEAPEPRSLNSFRNTIY
ncbi:MAG: biotin--[Clostridia bacterium]|nr:biotin--[acetyl-CoA-carboxylase] ligase [Clostridia bacterium]